MLEIELKFQSPNRAELEANLAKLGARWMETRDESDRYYNAPDRDFRATDEVFRLRTVNETGTLTYKGPKRGGTAKTRDEHEVDLAVGGVDAADRMIRALGYCPTAVVAKRRTIYALTRDGFELHVCLDALAGIGEFVEIEIVAEERDLVRAEAAVHAVAGELGLTRPDHPRRP